MKFNYVLHYMGKKRNTEVGMMKGKKPFLIVLKFSAKIHQALVV